MPGKQEPDDQNKKPEENEDLSKLPASELVKRVKKKKKGRPGHELHKVMVAAIRALKESEPSFSAKTIAKEIGCKEELVRKVLYSPKEASLLTPEQFDKIRLEYASEIAQIVNQLLRAANAEGLAQTLARTKNSAWVMTIGTLIDKLNNLLNRPTEITEVRDVAKEVHTDLERLKKMEEDLSKFLGKPEAGQEESN